jgi:serine/threonine protein kinase
LSLPLTREQFIDRLVQCTLLSADDVRAFIAALPDNRRPDDGEALALELIRSDRLTAFQASSVFEGRGSELVLGNYVLLDRLGEGGMGMVFKAEHRRMKRLVALKVLSPNYTKTPAALQRFQREVEAVAKLEHPNIVTAYDADQSGDTHFLVMHYVAGENLGAIVRRHGPLTVADAVNTIVQAARGLEYAHSRGVIHRDIKPQNLLLDESGTVKILDLGLARFEPTGFETGQTSLTQSGTFMGTVDFVSPEQALGGKHADRRSDVYSLGCTLFYLLTATPMYAGDTLMSKVQAHREGTIPSLTALRPEVPPALDAIFRRMVAKRADDRYQTMVGLLRDLESLPDQLGHANRRINTATFKTAPAATAGRREPRSDSDVDSSADDQHTAADVAVDRGPQTEILPTIAHGFADQPMAANPLRPGGSITAMLSSVVATKNQRAMWIGGSVAAALLGFVLTIVFGGRGGTPTAASPSLIQTAPRQNPEGDANAAANRIDQPPPEPRGDDAVVDADQRPRPPYRPPPPPPFGRPRPGPPLFGPPPRDDAPPREHPPADTAPENPPPRQPSND